MLPRGVLRAVRGRGYPALARSSLVALRPLRLYSSNGKPQRGPPKPPPYVNEQDVRKSAQDISNRGPVPNQTWSPDVGIKFTSDSPEQSSSTEHSTLQSQPSSPLRTTSTPPSKATAATAHPSPSNAPRRSSKLGGVPPTNSNGHEQATPQGARPQEPSQPQAPLPDLTQGIPSTFAEEFLKQNKPTSKDGEDAQSTGLDITEAQVGEHGQRGGDGGSRQKEEYISSIERRRNAIMRYTMISGAAFAVVGALLLGQNWEDSDEEQRHSDAPNGFSPGLFYGRIKARLNEMFGYYTEPAFPQLLPTMDPAMSAPYTLVMSLEDMLIHSKWTPQKGWQVAKRPGVDYFLRYLSQYYELVLFTSVYSMNADLDLSYLNRDLSKTLIIDTVKAHTQLQPENAVILPKWSGDSKDPHTNDLVALIPFLEYIATMGIQDVRSVLKSYEGTHIPTEFARREARAREAFNKQLEEERKKRGRVGSLTGSLSGMLGFKPSTGLMQVPGEPSLAEGLAQGKMLSDQMRERGQRNYLAIDKEIRENSEMWLKQSEEEQKKAQEEMAKSMQGNRAARRGLLFSSNCVSRMLKIEHVAPVPAPAAAQAPLSVAGQRHLASSTTLLKAPVLTMGQGDDNPEDTASMATSGPDLFSLPPEIRDEIYAHLLSSSRVRYVADDGHTKFRFHGDILRVNKQIHAEAKDSFRRHNVFVRIETPWQQSEVRIQHMGRVPLIAVGTRAAEFKHFHMSVNITTVDMRHIQPNHIIICLDDLEAFTTFWRYSSLSFHMLNPHLNLTLRLANPGWLPKVKNTTQIPKRLQRQLLLPFGIVKDLQELVIKGDFDQDIIDALQAEMKIPYPSPEFCLEECTRLKDAGNAELKAGNYRSAIQKYNEAQLAIFIIVDGRRRDVWGEDHFKKQLQGGLYDKQIGIVVSVILRIKLVANTMHALLKLEDYTEARYWGERSIGLMREHMEDSADEPRPGFAAAAEVGKIYYRTGLACKHLGDMSKAREFLRIASHWLPNDDIVKKEVAATALKLF
ncbi:hypothetical protein FH972_024685 [Carpinus fangiana]|uniref:FCP1 homology domain-containing protein n=1 Tax=Carpinus fangiana TaxID=176857 RepID=A0A5N6KZE1_9ROSI|nr:hypothetical protein FH972_024685 [Carpinus fangiana]